MTDFRALCAELLSEYEQCFTIADPSDSPLVQRARAALAKTKPQIPKNCWLDDEPNLYPSPCVFDDPEEQADNCMYAQKLRAMGETKTYCKYYREITETKPKASMDEV